MYLLDMRKPLPHSQTSKCKSINTHILNNADRTSVHGGSPWGAGTFAGSDGSRQPTELELELATTQGEVFGKQILQVNFSASA
jgi:multimeric flavodoxin WrbA